MKKKFLRRDASRFAKFGKGRGKKAKWRNPTGRHNKMREGKKGYSAVVAIGHRKTQGEKPVVIMNAKDLEKLKKGVKALVGRTGKKKKIEIGKKAIELKVQLENMNPKTFLNKNDKKKSEKSSEKNPEKKEGKK